MTKRLQSILLPSNNICDVEEMYFHRKGDWLLFNGYFNLFYLEKHHKYCDISELFLSLDLKGFGKLVVMHDDMEVYEESIVDGCVSVKLPYALHEKGVFWFKVQFDVAYYSGRNIGDDQSDSEKLWNISGSFNATRVGGDYELVKLGVNICTYKREPYVIRNMKSLIGWSEDVCRYSDDAVNAGCIDGEDIDDDGYDSVIKNLHFFIIDNGQTLKDNSEFCELVDRAGDFGKRIRVIPNANTGGAGGFGRGMQEAIDKKAELGLTHLLMMDDDAVFDPDLFVRLYGFLSMLRPEYRDITVGGALLREDYKYIQHAAGEWFTHYCVVNKHPLVDMREYTNCVSDWMTGTKDEHSLYGAWWCCCYHMDAITRENLPLPLFVHHDDIQFGMNQVDRGIVFLNGICVWHQGFELVYPGVKQYYNMRNTLITMDMFERKRLDKTYRYWAIRRYIGMLISYRYADCEFIYRRFKDFQKGRDWLLASDPEAIHKELMETYRNKCGMKPIEDIGLSSEEYAYVKSQIRNDFSESDLREYYTPDRFRGPVSKKITINGWFLPSKKGIKVITPFDSPWDVYRYKRVLLYEPATGKGAIMKRSMKELCLGFIRIFDMLLSKKVR